MIAHMTKIHLAELRFSFSRPSFILLSYDFALFTGGLFHDRSHDQDCSCLVISFTLFTGGLLNDRSHDQDSSWLAMIMHYLQAVFFMIVQMTKIHSA